MRGRGGGAGAACSGDRQCQGSRVCRLFTRARLHPRPVRCAPPRCRSPWRPPAPCKPRWTAWSRAWCARGEVGGARVSPRPPAPATRPATPPCAGYGAGRDRRRGGDRRGAHLRAAAERRPSGGRRAQPRLLTPPLDPPSAGYAAHGVHERDGHQQRAGRQAAGGRRGGRPVRGRGRPSTPLVARRLLPRAGPTPNAKPACLPLPPRKQGGV